MPGAQYDSTVPNFAAMTPEAFASWQQTRNAEAEAAGTRAIPELLDGVPAGADLTSATPSQITIGSAVPKPEPRADVWSTKKVATDFVCPSGQTCKMVRLQPQTLLEKGLLDKITRLEGLANELVEGAEGQPPKASSVPSSEDLQMVLDTLGMVIPLVVVEPKVYEDDDKDAPEGAIRVRDIDLEDRMAILEEAMKGLRALDRFRNP